MGIDILISKETAEQIAMEAFTSKTGVRSMNSAVERYVNRVLFPEVSDEYNEILYDRIPTLPQSLFRDYGIVIHMLRNIAQRILR